MELFNRSNKKSSVRRSTRSRNRMHERLDLDFGITIEEIPLFRNHWDPPERQTETLEISELRKSVGEPQYLRQTG